MAPHELWVVSHESFTCFTSSAFTLYTYYIKLSTEGHTVFLSFALQMSIPPQMSPALAPCVKTCVKKFAKNLAKNLQVHKNSKEKIFLANMLEMVC